MNRKSFTFSKIAPLHSVQFFHCFENRPIKNGAKTQFQKFLNFKNNDRKTFLKNPQLCKRSLYLAKKLKKGIKFNF